MRRKVSLANKQSPYALQCQTVYNQVAHLRIMLGNCSEDSQKPRALHLAKFHRLTPQFADTDARVRRRKIDQVRLFNLLAAFFRMRKKRTKYSRIQFLRHSYPPLGIK